MTAAAGHCRTLVSAKLPDVEGGEQSTDREEWERRECAHKAEHQTPGWLKMPKEADSRGPRLGEEVVRLRVAGTPKVALIPYLHYLQGPLSYPILLFKVFSWTLKNVLRIFFIKKKNKFWESRKQRWKKQSRRKVEQSDTSRTLRSTQCAFRPLPLKARRKHLKPQREVSGQILSFASFFGHIRVGLLVVEMCSIISLVSGNVAICL